MHGIVFGSKFIIILTRKLSNNIHFYKNSNLMNELKYGLFKCLFLNYSNPI